MTGRVQCSSTKKQTIRYTDTEKKVVKKFEVEPNTEYSIYVSPGVYVFSVNRVDFIDKQNKRFFLSSPNYPMRIFDPESI